MFQHQNNENHKIHRIPRQNHKKNQNQIFQRQNNENHKMIIISRQNHKKH